MRKLHRFMNYSLFFSSLGILLFVLNYQPTSQATSQWWVKTARLLFTIPYVTKQQIREKLEMNRNRIQELVTENKKAQNYELHPDLKLAYTFGTELRLVFLYAQSICLAERHLNGEHYTLRNVWGGDE